MTRQQSAFRFEDPAPLDAPALITDLPPGITSKTVLIDELAQRLRFPEYCGTNWDALEECVRDLSWLPPGPIVLRHSDLPLADDVVNAKTYLSILDGAVRKVSGSQNPRLVVVFPPEARDRIAWLLRLAAFEQSRL